MTGGGFFDRHAKELTLAFGGLVTVASVLAITLPTNTCSLSNTDKKSLGPEKKEGKRPSGPPEQWTDEELSEYLADRYVYPPEYLDRAGVVTLVENYIKASGEKK